MVVGREIGDDERQREYKMSRAPSKIMKQEKGEVL